MALQTTVRTTFFIPLFFGVKKIWNFSRASSVFPRVINYVSVAVPSPFKIVAALRKNANSEYAFGENFPSVSGQREPRACTTFQ
jgi:hypothetical protein